MMNKLFKLIFMGLMICNMTNTTVMAQGNPGVGGGVTLPDFIDSIRLKKSKFWKSLKSSTDRKKYIRMTESIDRFIQSANLSQNKGKCLHDDGQIKSLYHLYSLIEQKALIDQSLKDLKKIEPSQCSKEISNISKCFFNVVDRAKLKMIVKNQFFESYLKHQEQLDPDQRAKVVEFYNNVANGK